ncbi:gliding motility lipoprotein GldJ [Lutimonas zeaxanthinifaciens]|uniref:gliding motility lipoprotein GldJ n=1 Tax=Lutimonas zeaxanthinifaciens TaxID=3060215 RepID=UPI00265CF87E|nr:gliding motility lipoprotein GldJ [Lutimonas sp. YSD2104]WKK66867.1 gliding motility lipoprotein GldJ [Lutimonas sp. YSD2104]
MKKFSSNKVLLILFSAVLLTSCSKSNKSVSTLTGWEYNNPKYGGFQANSNYREQGPPPGMVLIEGGTFTMGSVQDDVMFDWNTTPVKQQVRSFYMDEAEVTNIEYLLYLQYLEKVFPPSDDTYRKIYQAALPDTLVWRNTLGYNELLTENYLRHPAYAEYPVVGVSWRQASEYCKWRTDRVNEKILIDKGVLHTLFDMDSLKVEGANRFDTETYLTNPNLLFDGDSTIYYKGIKDFSKKEKKTEGSFTGRHVKTSDGILAQRFRLPTEAEWEYAAKAEIENREYNSIRGRKKYSWNGNSTREQSRRYRGDQMANFKQGKGDYSGLAGWSNDGADITMRIKSYKPNAFGLYDMSGNVAEWVADVYRPIIDNDANDFSYFRGNVFNKKQIDKEGNVVVVDYNTVEFDTLDNGRIVPRDLPGSVKYVPVTKRDAFMRNNYEKAYNIDNRDGDLASTKQFFRDEDDSDEKPRMYNSPKIPRQIGESGLIIQQYDTKTRTTLISDQTRVFKGGSWKDRAYWMDPAQRRYLPEYMATNYIGFRCATDKLGQMSYSRRRKQSK